MAKRVPVLDPDGVFGTVDEADVPNLPLGARVLTKQQNAERAADEAYDKKSTAEKITSAASLAGPVPFVARAAYKAASGQGDEIVPTLPPVVESYKQGVSSTFAGGLPTLAERELARAGGGDKAAQQYVETADTAKEAAPVAHGLGQAAGVVGSVVAGGPKGAGPLGNVAPGVGISTAGSAVEAATAKALGGLASKGVLGRAAATSASMAARGAVEGGALAGADQATQNALHNDPIFGEKLYTAVGHGALGGLLIGGGLGGLGSLGASAVRGSRGALARGAAEATPAIETATTEAAPAAKPRGSLIKSGVVDTEAGLRAAGPEAQRAVDVGAVKGGGPGREPGLNLFDFGGFKPKATGEVAFRGGAEGADAGLPNARPLDFSKFEAAASEAPAAAKKVAEPVVETATKEAPAVTGPTKKLGLMDLLSSPKEAGRALANDQTWQAVGGGFGLQTTRYAKEAAKYFKEGTRDLGEIGNRYGIIDISETASPAAAAWKAAKSGTPADILPRIQAAESDVGSKIGDITDQSGARIPVADAIAAVDAVSKKYARQASRGHLADAATQYGEELRNALQPGKDGTVPLRDLLEQRKILDTTVYDEAKTLDPRGRLAALREVRSNLENLITDSLDAASGKVPGELKGQYKGLKRDYHGLRILREAAEDSAARSAKNASLSFSEKIGLAGALAGGHVLAGPVLALGGKVIRERGNAAAAAFLTRAVDSGALESVVQRLNAQVSQAAKGVLREPQAVVDVGRRVNAQGGRDDVVATQAQGERVAKWISQLHGNPMKLQNEIEDAASLVGRTAGPNAAASYTATAMRAIQFIAAHVPAKERRDPLDPRSTPPLTYDEAHKLVSATRYATQPSTIFADFDRGIVTPEGIEAAKEFAPSAFADFQMQLQEHIENHMLNNGRLTQSQRLRIDKLLGFPAGADLRPKAIQQLQANLTQPPPDEGPPANSPRGNKPVDLKVAQTGFDAVEARKAG